MSLPFELIQKGLTNTYTGKLSQEAVAETLENNPNPKCVGQHRGHWPLATITFGSVLLCNGLSSHSQPSLLVTFQIALNKPSLPSALHPVSRMGSPRADHSAGELKASRSKIQVTTFADSDGKSSSGILGYTKVCFKLSSQKFNLHK